MKGPLTTDGFRFSFEVWILAGSMLLNTCAGIGASRPSVHIERKGEKACFKLKVIDRLSDESVDEVIRLRPVVFAGVNLPPVQSFQVKSTSLASSGWPSDHLRFGFRWNVQVFRSALIPPLADVGSSVTMPGVIAPFTLPRKSGAYIVVSTISENVSEEALGSKESGSSYRSSVHVPPLTGVPADGVEDDDEDEAPPHALSISNSIATREKDIIRKRGLGFLSIISSSN